MQIVYNYFQPTLLVMSNLRYILFNEISVDFNLYKTNIFESLDLLILIT